MQQNLLKYTLLFITLFAFYAAFAGTKNPVDTGSVWCKEFVKTSENTLQERHHLELFWQKRGYLFAKADSVTPLKICIQLGRKMERFWLLLPLMANTDTFLTDANGCLSYMDNVLKQHENTGYPFAKTVWVPVCETSTDIWLRLETVLGPYYKLDSLIPGNLTFKNRLYKRAARVVLGQPYNEAALQLLLVRLSAMEGILPSGVGIDLTIVNGRLLAQLPVYKGVKNQFAGLLGLATSAVGKTQITGEVSGRFYNLFGQGADGNIEWRSFKARSQELKMGVGLPYILGTPFITALHLGFEKYDTIYTIFSPSVQFRFPLNAKSIFFVGIDQTNRTRIFADENIVRNFHQLPDNPSSRNSLVQLGFESRTIYPGTLPRKGYSIQIGGKAGYRTYVEDARIAAITWTASAGQTENVFDSLKRVGKFKTPQFRIEYNLSAFVPLSKLLVFKFAAQGFEFRTPVVYFNELTRFGGLKNVRGFNEQSIFANQMHSATLEIHAMAGDAGFFGPFYNFAWYNNQSNTGNSGDGILQGVGIVSGIKTAAGILQIIWAVGKTNTQPLALNNSKFHFGISNSF